MRFGRGFFVHIDWGMVAPAVILVSLSLTSVLSINLELFKNQLLFFGIAILAFIFFSQVNYKIFQYYSFYIYTVSIVLLFLVLVVGVESRGAVRWFELFGFRIQFSELIKPFFTIVLASFFAKSENRSFNNFILAIGLVLPIAILIFMQPDLGNAIVFSIVTILTLVFFGFPVRFFLVGLTLFLASLPILWGFLHEYQKQRIFSFINPTDPLGFSYNAIQSSIAVGSGMLFGRGFGEGTQSGLRFLPERHTDFIFATLAESLGFVGGVIIFLCFGFLLFRIFMMLHRFDNPFCRLFYGVSFFFILSQFFINISMNMGLLPIVGITLPFVSYGGSSLLSNFVLLGLLSAVGREARKEKVLEIR